METKDTFSLDNTFYGVNPFIKECVGCHETENLEKCDGSMCYQCWSRENE